MRSAPAVHLWGRGLRRFGEPIPTWYRFAYKLWDRNADLWAPVGIHLVLRFAHWWGGARWVIERETMLWEVRSTGRPSALLKEGGYYRDHWFHTGEWAA